MTHRVIIKEQSADEIVSGIRNFEVVKNDRHFRSGDLILFKTIDENGMFMYHFIDTKVYVITHIHSGVGIEPDYIIIIVKRWEEEQCTNASTVAKRR